MRIRGKRARRRRRRSSRWNWAGSTHTHSIAKQDLALLLGQLDETVESFGDEMKAQGVWDKVAVVVVSEFGRTLFSNGQGTDHAWGGTRFF